MTETQVLNSYQFPQKVNLQLHKVFLWLSLW